MNLPPNRGRGECRMPNAPAVSCAMIVVERTRVTTSTPESPGIPARNGFNGFLRALPGDRALLPPSPGGYVLSKPGRADSTPPNLTPASGRQDHTTSPYAATSLVSSLCDRSQASSTRPAIPSRAKRCRVHRIPSRVRDDHDTPLLWGGMARLIEMFLPIMEAKYFCKWGWTPLSTNRPTGKSPTRQREHVPLVSQTRRSVLHDAPQSRQL
jgi:hypothetical protein